MIVYRSLQYEINPADELVMLVQKAQTTAASNTHDKLRDLLIEVGVWESAVLDSLFHDEDSINSISEKLREISIFAGKAFCCSWNNERSRAKDMVVAVRDLLKSFPAIGLPASACARVPEGYAFYSLYPEHYCEAAKKIVSGKNPSKAVVLGIRSIGTSLSSATAGALMKKGCSAISFTVRPRGHPFDRFLNLSVKLQLELSKKSESLFIIVDEGPGLSGSSVISVAEALLAIGIPRERIVFLTSWIPSPSEFFSRKARNKWSQFTNYSSSFEDVWFENGKPVKIFTFEGMVEDYSAGGWRDHSFANSSLFPAINTTHERRKYLLNKPGSSKEYVMKFEGFGSYGSSAHEKAEVLWKAGFSPGVYGISDGFMMLEYLKGRQANQCRNNVKLLDRMAEYLSFRSNEFPSPEATSLNEIKEMTRVNTFEGLGGKWMGRVEKVMSGWNGDNASRLDGRMFPHEWICSEGKYLKTDSAHHDSDHFFPGKVNCAWDLAGACIEFKLNHNSAEYLISRYKELSGDKDILKKFHFYMIAYSAFRLGYSSLSAKSLQGSEDGIRFESLIPFYSSVLKRAIVSAEKKTKSQTFFRAKHENNGS